MDTFVVHDSGMDMNKLQELPDSKILFCLIGLESGTV